MKQIFSIILIAIFLAGCTATVSNNTYKKHYSDAGVQNASETVKSFPILDGPLITVAVYQFSDLTGQRKPGQVAHLSCLLYTSPSPRDS